MKCSFRHVYYFHHKAKPKPITKRMQVLGFDSEADYLGQPFMFAISDGTVMTPTQLWDTLFHKRYRGIRFVCWNLQYDEGAILSELSAEELDELRLKGKTTHKGYTVKSIQRKELLLSKGHKTVAFYDMAQFYGTSLDNAGKTYLGKSKIDLETKTFMPDYIKRNWRKLAEYCVYDAQLTAELAEYFIDILIDEVGITPQKLYSTGYISGIHFSRTCDVIDIKRFWTHHKEAIEMAYESYSGGKFEVYQRGFGYLYQYDINSAYPYEIANLQDIRYARYVRSKQYQSRATYGFLRAKLTITHDYSPISVKDHSLNFYPVGVFNRTITKAEYDYLTERGDKVEILDGAWFFCDGIKPYAKEVDRLFALKQTYKRQGEDAAMRYLLVKTLLNSFYGKFIQITAKWVTWKRSGQEGIRYEAGYHFNPCYASIITANVRLRLARVCDAHPEEIAAVHTDSLLTTTDLSNDGISIGDGLGDWGYVNEGDGVIVGSGVYQVGSMIHYRGFKGIPDLIGLVMANRHINIPVQQELVLSWRLVVFRHNDLDRINRFVHESKNLNLHFDTKREWNGKWTWTKELVGSHPRIHAQIADKLPDSLEKDLTLELK